MATMRELKRRISSVQSSQKITGAMKMISSARLRKAEIALSRAMPYEEQLRSILNHVNERDCDFVSPLRQEREVRQVAIVILGSDEGLCGAFNLNLYKKLVQAVEEYRTQGVEQPEVYPVGKKIIGDVRRMRNIRLKDIPDSFVTGRYAEGVKALSDELIACFQRGEIDRAEVIYTHFKSMGSQTVERLQLLPLSPRKQDEQAGPDHLEKPRMYIYEPGCREIFETLYPLMIRTLFYKVLLENQTSEQAIRIVAMQMASDNAYKLLGSLQLEYNKLRQQGITTELLDMAGGSVQE